MSPIKKLILAAMVAITATGCASRVEHKEFSQDQVGLAALREENVRNVVFGAEVQGYVAKYAIFAETVNQYVLKDLGGYVDKYNVYAREPISYAETGLQELDSYMLRAAQVAATVRVGTRLMNFVGIRLGTLTDMNAASKEQQEVYYTITPEQISANVQKIRDVRGTLSPEQKREVAKDVIALAADMAAINEATQQVKGLLVEGENLKARLSSSSYQAELQAKDGGRAKLLPEILSNLNGTLAGLRTAELNGASVTRNAKIWKIFLIDAIQ
jgi:hypothetical protein